MLIRNNISIIIIIILIFIIGVFFYFNSTPRNFPINTSFVINEDETLSSVSKRLESGGYIRSAVLLRAVISFFGNDKNIQLGEWVFDKKYSTLELSSLISSKSKSKPLIKITIPEGSTDEEISQIISSKLPNFDKSKFLKIVNEKNLSGKLFPLTYYLLPSTSEERIVEILNDNFEQVYNKNFSKSSQDNLTKDEVIILASIIEGEAKAKEDMQIVSQILLDRLRIGMALQVDVAKETYKERGLIKKPINNPGVSSIYAVFNPSNTDYLYYITGNDGNMYYSKTFEEHKRNIAKYLK